MSSQCDPERLITSIRESFVNAVEVYTRGSCFRFYEILRVVFPQAVAWYDPIVGHVTAEIDGRFYDITGRLRRQPTWHRLGAEPRIAREAHRWLCRVPAKYGDSSTELPAASWRPLGIEPIVDDRETDGR